MPEPYIDAAMREIIKHSGGDEVVYVNPLKAEKAVVTEASERRSAWDLQQKKIITCDEERDPGKENNEAKLGTLLNTSYFAQTF